MHPSSTGLRVRLSFASTLLLLTACGAPPEQKREPMRAGATDEVPHDERMGWWRQARFGLFVHWGLYAIPAGAWNGKTNYGEWIRDSAQIPLDTYDRFQSLWNPEHFDADAWVRMAKAAGMQYVVITSKHHDGFCLWDSRFTDWDVGKTQNPRDVLGELAAACKQHGLRFCTYHSIMDWHHPDYLPRRPWEAATRSSEGADFKRFESYLHAQVTELVERYHPSVMWFDGEWESTWSHERGLKLWSLCRALDPRMLVNNRVDVHRGGMAGFSQNREAVGDFATPEQEIPPTGLPGVDWESCMTMNDHWGWNAASKQWKSTQDLLRNLIDIASKGGNYLLNIGPRADGTFPPESVQRLAEIGTWMDRAGEAIHGTTASVFERTPWGRCTVRAGDTTSTLYLHVFDAKTGQTIELTGLQNRVHRAGLLSGKGSVMPAPTPAGTPVFTLQLEQADPIATVIAVEIEGRPDVLKAPTIQTDGEQFVQAATATIVQTSPSVVTTFTLDGSEPTADSPRFAAPLRIETTCTLRTASFRDGARMTDVVSRTFTKVTPLPPAKVLAKEPGLRVERFPGAWQEIPDDLEGRAPEASWIAPDVQLPKDIGEHVLLVLRGVVEVPADDVYTFTLTSDDGSELWIDGQRVVDHDGPHGPTDKLGTVALAQGAHTLKVVWFNATGGAHLDLQWARPGAAMAKVPAAQFRH